MGAQPESRLDEAKIETLRTWGEGLSADPREEVRAAGRAIAMLVEEIERLNVDLWNARVQAESPFRTAREADGSPFGTLVPRFGA